MPPIKVFKPPIGYSKAADTPREQKKDFVLSWKEWATQNYVQVVESNVASGTETFTVPTGNTLILTEAHAECGATGTGNSVAHVDVKGERIISASAHINTNNSAVLTGVLLKIESGETVDMILAGDGGSFGLGSAGFIGFLIPIA